MARRRSLSTSADYFALAARAAFSNPFADEYADFCRQLGGSNDPGAMAAAVASRVDALAAAGRAELRAYRGEERDTMQLVFLFEVYQRFRPALDALIADQLRAAEKTVLVPFAADALALLRRRGFAAEEAIRYFAIFFQIRRAAHFIEHGLIGRSACMKEFRRRLWQSVFTHDIRTYERCLWNRMEDFSTLLLGETGTGKGAAAAAIGRSAFIPFEPRHGAFAESFTRSFVGANLSQFPETLIESELFGHRKGAFTGAVEAHEGIFARCSSHGAIFLDEIGDVAVPVQIKLLQVLQERTFSPVGSHEVVRFRGRIVAATNRPLAELRSRGLFRDDFYYRLCSDAITVPPLRQRLAEDPRELDDLLRHLLDRMTGGASADLLAGVRENLLASAGRSYPWPGNVRELEQAVRRILLTGRYEPDTAATGRNRATALAAAVESGALDADALLAAYCALLYERTGNLEEVARRTQLDRRTVKRYLALPPAK
jgi:DNA-binding NtrC family response regulator